MNSRLQITYEQRIFDFKVPSGTSRGILTRKKSWFIYVSDGTNNRITGTGECSIIEGLTPEYESDEQYENLLKALVKDPTMDLSNYPSLRFGMETALLDLYNGGKGIYFNNSFTRGERRIPINGLIWMGSPEYMNAQIQDKLKQGYTTIKLKIGAIDREQELTILRSIRAQFGPDQITLRVDANGAYDLDTARKILQELRNLHVHSIEQPIPAGKWEEMTQLCSENLIPIALDEELIGIQKRDEKIALLETINPDFIILKPSLHGGISGCREWIEIAESMDIDWWITSALESNIGLDAIAQFTAEYDNVLPQGLGTGSLYVNNIESNLKVANGYIFKEIQT